MSTRRAKLTPYSQIKREPVEYLEPGRVPLGALTILAGIPGLGKTQWTLSLAGRTSRGELPCGEATAILATAEDSPAAVVKPRLHAVQANMDKVVQVTIELADDAEDGILLPTDTSELEACVQEEGARLVVVDPLVAFLGGSVDSWKDAGVRQALAPLAALAARQGCAVVGVMHLNKSMSTDPFMRLGGSVGFGGAARSVLVLGRDPDDAEDGNRRVLAQTKNNYAPLAPSLLYEVEPILLPAEGDEPEVETSRLRLLGESEHDGRALLMQRGDEEEGSEAERFLLDMLATGPVAADEVKREAKSAGIGERALTKARNALGIRMPDGIKRVGGIAGQGHWTWQIPMNDAAKNDSPITQNVVLSANPHENTDSSDDSSLRTTAATNGDLRRPVFESEEHRRLAGNAIALERLTREEAEKEALHARIREQEALLATGSLDAIAQADERGEL